MLYDQPLDTPTWVKSTFCGNSFSCVEVAGLPGGNVGVRKDARGPVLEFTPEEWKAFTQGVQAGQFDRFGNS